MSKKGIARISDLKQALIEKKRIDEENRKKEQKAQKINQEISKSINEMKITVKKKSYKQNTLDELVKQIERENLFSVTNIQKIVKKRGKDMEEVEKPDKNFSISGFVKNYDILTFVTSLLVE